MSLSDFADHGKKMNIKEEIELALKSANERALLGVLYSVTKQEIKAAFDDSKWIFCRICELGFSSALQYVLDLHVSNVNDAYDGVSKDNG